MLELIAAVQETTNLPNSSKFIPRGKIELGSVTVCAIPLITFTMVILLVVHMYVLSSQCDIISHEASDVYVSSPALLYG